MERACLTCSHYLERRVMLAKFRLSGLVARQAQPNPNEVTEREAKRMFDSIGGNLR